MLLANFLFGESCFLKKEEYRNIKVNANFFIYHICVDNQEYLILNPVYKGGGMVKTGKQCNCKDKDIFKSDKE